MQEKEVGIYELAKAVREEIIKLRKDEDIQKEPILYLDSLDLELSVVVSEVTKGGIKFYILSAGAEYEKERVSRIKLSFKPILSQEELDALRKSGVTFFMVKTHDIRLTPKSPSTRKKRQPAKTKLNNHL
ncbi:TPA: hypothetical protein ENX78_07990 [Candidatus Poribacteria bacterium]|jgi:hypothetical protein|nr:hypothetical protein [Candidatus Poribacteria bacterium]